MSTDLSNNFLHNNNRVFDLSTNSSNRFMSLLVDFINSGNINENLSMLPIANTNYSESQPNRFNQILNNSLMDKKAYKKIISNEGLKQLKKIIYDENKYETKECVISMEEFKNGDEITQLPCNHIFHTKSINTWLKEESHKCPVCRYELDYTEIKNNEENIIIDLSRNTNMNRMFNNMNFLYNPIEYLYRPSITNIWSQSSSINRIINNESSFIENRNLQNAILSSINNQYTENIDLSSDEDVNIFEGFDAFDDDGDLF
jgi:hypothetical protein